MGTPVVEPPTLGVTHYPKEEGQGITMDLSIDWSSFVVGVGNGILIMNILHRWEKRAEHPYRWKCTEPGCSFTVAGNDMPVLDAFILNHKEAMHR
jgi:hypothetical protein